MEGKEEKGRVAERVVCWVWKGAATFVKLLPRFRDALVETLCCQGVEDVLHELTLRLLQSMTHDGRKQAR